MELKSYKCSVDGCEEPSICYGCFKCEKHHEQLPDNYMGDCYIHKKINLSKM